MVERPRCPIGGTHAPERIDSQSFLELMTQHGMPWHVIDLPPHD
jgi:hypothetical protein